MDYQAVSVMVIFIGGFVTGIVVTIIFIRWLSDWAASYVIGSRLW